MLLSYGTICSVAAKRPSRKLFDFNELSNHHPLHPGGNFHCERRQPTWVPKHLHLHMSNAKSPRKPSKFQIATRMSGSISTQNYSSSSPGNDKIVAMSMEIFRQFPIQDTS